MTVSKKVKELKSIIEIYVILFHNIYIYIYDITSLGQENFFSIVGFSNI